MVTAAQRQLSCHLCRCEVTDSEYLPQRISECANTALDGLCQELDHCRMQLVQGPVCRSCFQDLEKLNKAQTTMALLKVRFVGCLRTWITSTLLSKNSTSRKKCASDSPLTSSTPWSRSPAQKKLVVVHTDSLVPEARSLVFNTESVSQDILHPRKSGTPFNFSQEWAPPQEIWHPPPNVVVFYASLHVHYPRISCTSCLLS